MIYDVLLIYKPFRSAHDQEDGFWPCSCQRCKNRDRAAWETRKARGAVVE